MRILLFLLWFAVALASLYARAQAAPGPAGPPAASSALNARPSPPSPDANGVYQLGDGITPPRVVHVEEASFTDKARKLRVQGTSTVSVTVDKNGRPENVHTVHSVAETMASAQGSPLSSKIEKAAQELDRSAIRTVEKYRFEPARFEGAAVAVEIEVEVSYHLY